MQSDHQMFQTAGWHRENLLMSLFYQSENEFSKFQGRDDLSDKGQGYYSEETTTWLQIYFLVSSKQWLGPIKCMIYAWTDVKCKTVQNKLAL